MEVRGQLHAPTALALGKESLVTCTHFITGWVGPKAGLDVLEK